MSHERTAKEIATEIHTIRYLLTETMAAMRTVLAIGLPYRLDDAGLITERPGEMEAYRSAQAQLRRCLNCLAEQSEKWAKERQH